MKISSTTINEHNFSREEFIILCEAENIILQLMNSYPKDTVLMNPNTGEVLLVNDLSRVRGALGFITESRVVKVNP